MNVLITGGASGLGEAITRRLASDVLNTVYFTYSRSQNKSNEIVKEFSNVVAIKCDFGIEEDVIALNNKIKTIDLDVLVNNAFTGEPIKTYFHKIPLLDFKQEFDRNILPTISITQASINVFRKKKSGKIITILTSYLLNTPPAGTAVYVAMKAYMASLTKSWASENTKYNISSNTISPSFMLTGLADNIDERVVEQLIETHPLKKLLTTSEVAETVSFLTKATEQMSGVDIVINAAVNIK